MESLQKLAIIDADKVVLHDLAIEGVGAVAVKATEGVMQRLYRLSCDIRPTIDDGVDREYGENLLNDITKFQTRGNNPKKMA